MRSIGYVLPLARERECRLQRAAAGSPARWFFRDDRMYLIPGDSPMGYRLPLDSLPWVSEGRLSVPARARPVRTARAVAPAAQLRMQYGGGSAGREGVADARPRGGVGAAAARVAERHAADGGAAGTTQRAVRRPAPAAARRSRADGSRRTALCVEARDPRRADGPKAERSRSAAAARLLYVFMPPLAALEDYLDLLAAVEATAADAAACRSCSKAIRRRATRA